MTLGYWNYRCLGVMVQYMLELCHCDYQFKRYTILDDDNPKKEWRDVRHTMGLDFPNLPYLIDGDMKLTQCMPIMRYICRKYKPELLGTTLEEQTQVDVVANVIFGIYWQTVDIPYFKPDSVDEYLNESYKQLEEVEKYIADKPFLIGDQLRYG